jgi:hypothetical protein
MAAVEKNLSWILGENDGLDEHVRRIDAEASDFKASLN